MPYTAIGVPYAAPVAAVPMLWGWGWGWGIGPVGTVICVILYCVATTGVTAGFHRCPTHGAFKADRALHTGLAVAGGLAPQGPPIAWVAHHRKHHQYAGGPDDPHSPWRCGTSPLAVAKGICHAHVGWLFATAGLLREVRPGPAQGLRGPAVSHHHWRLTAFFRGAPVRFALVHHVEWSTGRPSSPERVARRRESPRA